jgi:Fe-S-cluster containining protein
MTLPIVGQLEHKPGPLEEKLAALWPIARGRLYRWGHLRQTLALRRRFSLSLLHVGQLKVAIPQGKLPDCESCEDICCTGPNAIVSLRLRDIAALVDAGLERFIESERPQVPVKEPTWARREADGSVFHQAFPVLARDATGTCALLTEDRRCGAFPAWPLSCARYPYALDLQSRVVFWAKGCASTTIVSSSEAPVRVRALLRAVVDAYNERVKDAVRLSMAREELEALGLLKYVKLENLDAL